MDLPPALLRRSRPIPRWSWAILLAILVLVPFVAMYQSQEIRYTGFTGTFHGTPDEATVDALQDAVHGAKAPWFKRGHASVTVKDSQFRAILNGDCQQAIEEASRIPGIAHLSGCMAMVPEVCDGGRRDAGSFC